MDGPTNVEALAATLNLAHSDRETDQLPAVVDAVNSWISTFTAPAGGTWPPHIVHGATMLAARIYRRRNSPAGVEAFNEMGPAYVSRNDPDVAQLLGLGRWRPLQVG